MTNQQIKEIRERDERDEGILVSELCASHIFSALIDRSQLLDEVERVYAIANNAIYFADRADYLRCLYEICEHIKPGTKCGEEYIYEV